MLQNNEPDFDAYVGAVETSENQNAQNESNKKGFPTPPYCAIGNKAIVRFVNGIAETAMDQGKPGTGRAKLFNVGWVKDDNGKPFPLVLPAILKKKPMYKSILCDFIDKVLTNTWIDFTPEQIEANKGTELEGKKGQTKYFYANRDDYGVQQSGEMTLKQIFWNVFKSGVDPNSQYYKSARTWRGQTIYVANVIDRLNYDWHRENKKTKILVKKVTVNGDRVNAKNVSFYVMGESLKDLADNHGHALDYDVMIIPGAENNDKFKLYNVSGYKESGYWNDVKKIITDEEREKVSILHGFSEEEQTWDTIDIDKYYRLTSAKVILDHLGKTIRNFDMMTGSNFYEQLQAEAALDAKAKKADAATTAPAAATQPTAQPVAQPAVATPATAPVNAAPVANVTPAQPVAPAQPIAQPIAQPQAPTQPAAPVAPAQPSFNTMANIAPATAAPEPIPVSSAAQQNIDQFYDSLDD